MAWTAHKNKDDLREHFDSSEELQKEATALVELIRQSRHFIIFTGAGISTSAGIPDFRGPQGVWTLQAQGKSRTEPTVDCVEAIPTPTHMAIVELMKAGILKYLISQNCDGLHRKSGVPPQQISELHGNTNLEYCKKCGKEYLRDFDACATYEYDVHDHRTGRYCSVSGCGGELHDSIINFNESLPVVPLQRGREHSRKADLCLVLGSSLTVSPACNMPKMAGENGKLVICNLQRTPLDYLASMKIHAKCDDLMKLVMKGLGLEIPPFVLHRQLVVTTTQQKNGVKVALHGVDVDGVPVSFLRGIKLLHPKVLSLTREPFEVLLSPSDFPQENEGEKEEEDTTRKVDVVLHFFGHYNEPPLPLSLPLSPQDSTTLYDLAYNPMTGEWAVSS